MATTANSWRRSVHALLAVTGAAVIGLGISGSASAQQADPYVNGSSTTATVQDVVIEQTPTSDDVRVKGAQVERGSLAVTGGDVLGLAAIAGGALVLGVPLVRAGRARKSTNS